MVAAVRPDAWNLPLFVHVAGAMLLVGALFVVAATMAAALRGGGGSQVLSGLAFRTVIVGVLPSYLLMRVGAEWIAAEEDVPSDVDWIGMGYAVADGGLLLTIVAALLAWRAARRGAAGPGGLGRGVLVMTAILIVAYGVAIWAMAAKPG
jgi:hypothetical protein